MVIPGVEVVHEKVKSVRQVCLLNERLPFLLANHYIISQPLSSKPQPAPHKHETEVANPQYLLHWQHLIPQNQIAAVYVLRSGRMKPQRVLPNPDTKHWTCQVKAETVPISTFADRSVLRTPGPQPLLCLGSSGTRALGNASLSVLAKKCQAGSGRPWAYRSAHSQRSRTLTVCAPLPNKQYIECVYPHPLNNTGRDEHTS